MKILATGTPGSGKTSLARYAHTQNDKRFFDTDEINGLCEWREFKSGKVLGLVTDHKATGDSGYKKYGWYWNVDLLNNFLTSSPLAILSGSSENLAECYKYFDKIFLLKKTERELLDNLLSSDRKNPFGKTPEQRKNFMNWQNYLIKEVEKYPYTIIEGNNILNVYRIIHAYIESDK